MVALPIVQVTIDGSPVVGSTPARLVDGHVVAPLDPYVVRVADEIAPEGGGRRAVIVRGQSRIIVSLQHLGDAPRPVVALAALVRALGGSVRYDAAANVLEIALERSTAISPPAPPVATSRDQAHARVVPAFAEPKRAGVPLEPRPRRTPPDVAPSFP